MSKKITITEEQLQTLLRSAWNQGHQDGISSTEPNDRSFCFDKDKLFNNNREWMSKRTTDILQLKEPIEIDPYKY